MYRAVPARFAIAPILVLAVAGGIGLTSVLSGPTYSALTSEQAIRIASGWSDGQDVHLVAARHQRLSDFMTSTDDHGVWVIIFGGGSYPSPSCGPIRPNPVCPPPAHSFMDVLDDRDGRMIFVEFPARELREPREFR